MRETIKKGGKKILGEIVEKKKKKDVRRKFRKIAL
jgi:hypothetical protein